MPSFKSDLDIQQNQLLNAVLHTLRDLPQNPVAGQLYYNEGKQTAYLYNGNWWMPWGEYSGGQTQQVKQYFLNIPNPSTKTSMVFARLYEAQDVVRIDSHFSTESIVDFNIESRRSVNDRGFSLTERPIRATYAGTETTEFANSSLPKGDWLYIEIVQKDDGVIVPKEAEPDGLSGETEPPAATTDSEILGLLTITITCVTN